MRNFASTDGLPVCDDHDVDDDGDDARGRCLKSFIDMRESYQGRNPNRIAKHQRIYLVKNVDSEAGEVDWQGIMNQRLPISKFR